MRLVEQTSKGFRQTVKAFLAVTGRNRPVPSGSGLCRSVDVRNPYVVSIDPVQVNLSRRLRRTQEDERLGEALLVTMDGAAAGLCHSG